MPVMIAEPLAMSRSDRTELERMARSTSLPHRTVRQAKALLLAAEGVANEEIARRSEVDADTVRRWRRRFDERGVAGVGVIAEGPRAQVVAARGHGGRGGAGDARQCTPPDGSTHWTTRTLAEHLGIGKDTVARIWRDHDLKPWKVDDLQDLQRSALRGEARRRGRALHGPARAGGGVQLRREDPVPGARSHPAIAAHEARVGRGP